MSNLPKTVCYHSEVPIKSIKSFGKGQRRCHKANFKKFMQDQIRLNKGKDMNQVRDYQRAVEFYKRKIKKMKKAQIEVYSKDRIDYYLPINGTIDKGFLFSRFKKYTE